MAGGVNNRFHRERRMDFFGVDDPGRRQRCARILRQEQLGSTTTANYNDVGGWQADEIRELCATIGVQITSNSSWKATRQSRSATPKRRARSPRPLGSRRRNVSPAHRARSRKRTRSRRLHALHAPLLVLPATACRAATSPRGSIAPCPRSSAAGKWPRLSKRRNTVSRSNSPMARRRMSNRKIWNLWSTSRHRTAPTIRKKKTTSMTKRPPASFFFQNRISYIAARTPKLQYQFGIKKRFMLAKLPALSALALSGGSPLVV